MTDADLSYAKLSRARLAGTTLCGAKLCGAILIDCDLTGANLKSADLYDADLFGAKLSGTVTDHAIYNRGTRLPANFNPYEHRMTFLGSDAEADEEYAGRSKSNR